MQFYNLYLTGLENPNGTPRTDVYLGVSYFRVQEAEQAQAHLEAVYGEGSVAIRREESIPQDNHVMG